MSPEPRQIGAAAACLLVRDVRVAADYYAEKLGFRTPQFYGEPPTFAIPQRDGQSIMLARANEGNSVHANSTDFGMFSAYFWVRDVDALHSEFTANGADIAQEPQDREYGIREIYVRDADGHLICFGSDIEESTH
ncbi:VOC family protein [Aurantiacibacter sp. D1-12]|uniref:VOC family protein n=1 Tax=Aurantiacibacter sp. D1-12 TaxID=2993658 RepID=UPI00237CF849|nr:VOC family protein [Aurantiacibacter sp. D1-12]MDE1466613.1 VOC family protein [Aurantiacibacter sp. D1-12]